MGVIVFAIKSVQLDGLADLTGQVGHFERFTILRLERRLADIHRDNRARCSCGDGVVLRIDAHDGPLQIDILRAIRVGSDRSNVQGIIAYFTLNDYVVPFGRGYRGLRRRHGNVGHKPRLAVIAGPVECPGDGYRGALRL